MRGWYQQYARPLERISVDHDASGYMVADHRPDPVKSSSLYCSKSAPQLTTTTWPLDPNEVHAVRRRCCDLVDCRPLTSDSLCSQPAGKIKLLEDPEPHFMDFEANLRAQNQVTSRYLIFM